MSNPNLSKILLKIIQENVLSGDFKVAKFKSNLKEFLKFVTATFSFINADKDQSSVNTTIDAVCSKLVASSFSKLKSPKTSRVYLSVVYGSRVLGLQFSSQEEVREHLNKRYGPNLVLATDTIELGKFIYYSLLIRANSVVTQPQSTSELSVRSAKQAAILTVPRSGKR